MSAPTTRPRTLLGFLVRCVGWSIPLFLAWEYLLRDPWVGALAHLFAATARLVGLDVQVLGVQGGKLQLSYAGATWIDEFGLTGINVVALVALLLATGPTNRRRRLRLLGTGLALLIATQVIALYSDLVHVHLRASPVGLRFADGLRNFMLGFGTFLFPLLIWLLLARDLPPLRRSGKRSAPPAKPR